MKQLCRVLVRHSLIMIENIHFYSEASHEDRYEENTALLVFSTTPVTDAVITKELATKTVCGIIYY